MVENPVFYQKSKPVDIKYSFLFGSSNFVSFGMSRSVGYYDFTF